MSDIIEILSQIDPSVFESILKTRTLVELVWIWTKFEKGVNVRRREWLRAHIVKSLNDRHVSEELFDSWEYVPSSFLVEFLYHIAFNMNSDYKVFFDQKMSSLRIPCAGFIYVRGELAFVKVNDLKMFIERDLYEKLDHSKIKCTSSYLK